MARGKESAASLKRAALRRAGFPTADSAPKDGQRSLLGKLGSAKRHRAPKAKIAALQRRVDAMRAQKAFVSKVLSSQPIAAIGDSVERARAVAREAMPGGVAVVAYIACHDPGASKSERLQAARLLGEWTRLQLDEGERDPLDVEPGKRVSRADLANFLRAAASRLDSLRQPVEGVVVSSSATDNQGGGGPPRLASSSPPPLDAVPLDMPAAVPAELTAPGLQAPGVPTPTPPGAPPLRAHPELPGSLPMATEPATTQEILLAERLQERPELDPRKG